MRKSKEALGILLVLVLGINCLFLGPISTKVNAVAEYTVSTSVDDICVYQGSLYKGAWYKWDTTSIPLHRTVSSAIVKLYRINAATQTGDNLRIWRVNNQTWSEDDSHSEIFALDVDTSADYTGLEVSNGWKELDVTNQFQANYGSANFTIRLFDPDWILTSSAGVITGSGTNIGYDIASTPEDMITLTTHEHASYHPQLIVTLSIPAGTLLIEYYAPTIGDQASSITPQKHWNETQLLYVTYFYIYEDGTNVSVAGIPTSYSFSYINQNTTYSDDISSSGEMNFTSLYEGTYEVVFDPNQDWHKLHISLYAPDGVGVMWESFQIYINNTRVPFPPEYDLEIGYYEYEVKDYFSQVVLEGNFTLYASDPEDVHQNWEVPLYKVAFVNKDVVPYNVEITRNSITRVWPSDSTDIRLYGLASELPYTIVIRNVDTKEVRDSYTLYMSNDPQQKLLNYEPDEVDYIGGVAQVVKLLEPRDFILPAFFLLGGFALISSVTSRRSKKQQTRKDWRQAYLTQKGVTHASQLSSYDRRKFHEAEEHRFGKSRLRRKQG